jgi:hypothetical protein
MPLLFSALCVATALQVLISDPTTAKREANDAPSGHEMGRNIVPGA